MNNQINISLKFKILSKKINNNTNNKTNDVIKIKIFNVKILILILELKVIKNLHLFLTIVEKNYFTNRSAA